MVMHVYSEAATETGAMARTKKVSSGNGVSGAFMEALNQKMFSWIDAIKDGKVTAGELNSINNDPARSLNDLSEEEQGATIYDGVAATFYASAQLTEVSNVMQWMLKAMNIEKELDDKIASALGS